MARTTIKGSRRELVGAVRPVLPELGGSQPFEVYLHLIEVHVEEVCPSKFRPVEVLTAQVRPRRGGHPQRCHNVPLLQDQSTDAYTSGAAATPPT